MPQFLIKMILLSIALATFLACGEAEETDSTNCKTFIEAKSWQEAIDCYEDGDFDESPEDNLEAEEYIYLATWAGAYAGKYDLTGTAIIESLLEEDGGDEGEDSGGSPIDFTSQINEYASLGTLSTAVTDMQRCMDLILAIPEAIRDPESDTAGYYAEDISKIGAIYAFFLVDLQKKDFDDSLLDTDLTDEELLDKADALIATLENGGSIVSDPELQAQIDAQLEELNSQPGDNNKEKLEALLNQ